LYHWVEHPDFEREVAIIGVRAPHVPSELGRQVASAAGQFRDMGMYKPPGVAETLDWANALHLLSEITLTEESVDATLGALLKYREDQERARRAGIESVIETALRA
jgi:MoxR-like ATPase